jgi:hypothetical protein
MFSECLVCWHAPLDMWLVGSEHNGKTDRIPRPPRVANPWLAYRLPSPFGTGEGMDMGRREMGGPTDNAGHDKSHHAYTCRWERQAVCSLLLAMDHVTRCELLTVHLKHTKPNFWHRSDAITCSTCVNTHKIILLAAWISRFSVILTLNSDYFLKQH